MVFIFQVSGTRDSAMGSGNVRVFLSSLRQQGYEIPPDKESLLNNAFKNNASVYLTGDAKFLIVYPGTYKKEDTWVKISLPKNVERGNIIKNEQPPEVSKYLGGYVPNVLSGKGIADGSTVMFLISEEFAPDEFKTTVNDRILAEIARQLKSTPGFSKVGYSKESSQVSASFKQDGKTIHVIFGKASPTYQQIATFASGRPDGTQIMQYVDSTKGAISNGKVYLPDLNVPGGEFAGAKAALQELYAKDFRGAYYSETVDEKGEPKTKLVPGTTEEVEFYRKEPVQLKQTSPKGRDPEIVGQMGYRQGPFTNIAEPSASFKIRTADEEGRILVHAGLGYKVDRKTMPNEEMATYDVAVMAKIFENDKSLSFVGLGVGDYGLGVRTYQSLWNNCAFEAFFNGKQANAKFFFQVIGQFGVELGAEWSNKTPNYTIGIQIAGTVGSK